MQAQLNDSDTPLYASKRSQAAPKDSRDPSLQLSYTSRAFGLSHAFGRGQQLLIILDAKFPNSLTKISIWLTFAVHEVACTTTTLSLQLTLLSEPGFIQR